MQLTSGMLEQGLLGSMDDADDADAEDLAISAGGGVGFRVTWSLTACAAARMISLHFSFSGGSGVDADLASFDPPRRLFGRRRLWIRSFT